METLDYLPIEAENPAYGYNVYDSDQPSGDANEAVWDSNDSLTDLVSANANVIVRCQWMGGAVVTVSEAMFAYNWPVNMTPEDQPAVIADVYALLANKVEEKEEKVEPKEDNEKEEKEKPESKVKTEPKKPVEIKIEQPKQIPNTKEQVAVPTTLNLAEPTVPPGPKKDKPVIQIRQPDPAEPKVLTKTADRRVAAELVDAPAEVKVIQAQNTKVDKPILPQIQPVNVENIQAIPAAELRAQTHSSEPEIIEAIQIAPSVEVPAIVVDPTIVAKLISVSFDAEAKPPILVTEIEPVFESEAEDFLPLDHQIPEHKTIQLDSDVIDFEWQPEVEPKIFIPESEENTELDQIELTLPELAEPILEAAEQQISIEIADETKIVESSPQAVELEPAYEVEEELNSVEAVRETELEVITKIVKAAEAIDQPVIELVEKIEVSPPEIAEIACETLEQIVEIIVKLEVIEDEAVVNEPEVQAEIEELYVELFELLELDYTEDLIESLAKFTIIWNLAAEIQISIEASSQTAQDPGTHEIIAKLLAGLNTAKRALASAGALGKSAITLYSLGLSPLTENT